jgi:hypothetical protein
MLVTFSEAAWMIVGAARVVAVDLDGDLCVELRQWGSPRACGPTAGPLSLRSLVVQVDPAQPAQLAALWEMEAATRG